MKPQINADERSSDSVRVHPRSSAVPTPFKMPPNAPQCPQMPPEKSIRQNEPTMGRSGAFGSTPAHRPPPAVDASLRQLTPVNPGLPQHAIWQNEPTDPPTRGIPRPRSLAALALHFIDGGPADV